LHTPPSFLLPQAFTYRAPPLVTPIFPWVLNNRSPFPLSVFLQHNLSCLYFSPLFQGGFFRLFWVRLAAVVGPPPPCRPQRCNPCSFSVPPLLRFPHPTALSSFFTFGRLFFFLFARAISLPLSLSPKGYPQHFSWLFSLPGAGSSFCSAFALNPLPCGGKSFQDIPGYCVYSFGPILGYIRRDTFHSTESSTCFFFLDLRSVVFFQNLFSQAIWPPSPLGIV